MPRRDVLMKIVQPELKVEAPDAGATGKLERDVIPLLLDESGWATVSPFAPMVEADHPGSSMTREMKCKTSRGP